MHKQIAGKLVTSDYCALNRRPCMTPAALCYSARSCLNVGVHIIVLSCGDYISGREYSTVVLLF